MLDVHADLPIAAPAEKVAAIMFDPDLDAEWVGGARQAKTLTSAPFGVGSQVERQGGFLGRKFSWVTEVVRFDPGSLLEMKFLRGPFTGGVSYAVAPDGENSVAGIRITGRAGFWAPLMGLMMRASIKSDLRRLKKMAEAGQ